MLVINYLDPVAEWLRPYAGGRPCNREERVGGDVYALSLDCGLQQVSLFRPPGTPQVPRITRFFDELRWRSDTPPFVRCYYSPLISAEGIRIGPDWDKE